MSDAEQKLSSDCTLWPQELLNECLKPSAVVGVRNKVEANALGILLTQPIIIWRD
jgi:hypothetical protein